MIPINPWLNSRPRPVPMAGFYYLAALGVVLGTAPARAATLTVNTLADVVSSTDGVLSLREAILTAHAGDTIDFSVTGAIRLRRVAGGQLSIGKNLTITGPGADKLTVLRDTQESRSYRVFNITAGTVSISGLAIRNGRAPVSGGDNGGGGILNNGTLTLRDCTVSGNVAIGSSGEYAHVCTGFFGFAGNGAQGQGGGICNQDTLTIINCTVSGNTARGGMGGSVGCTDDPANTPAGNGGIGQGGGIYNVGTLSVVNSTVSGNFATPGQGGTYGVTVKGLPGRADGGGIFNANNGDNSSALSLVNCTVSNNTAGSTVGPGSAGGIFQAATCDIRNTLVAGNADVTDGKPDAVGVFDSQGHNLISRTDGSSGWKASDLTGTAAVPREALLDPAGLQDNGGPTPTIKLLAGSPAINVGDDLVLSAPFGLATDQRGPGFARKVGAHVDIGAYEADAPQSSSTTLIVNTLDEHSDGLCGVVDCSLWDAANAANADVAASTINFKAGLSGTVTTTLQATGIHLTAPVTINGPGARIITVSGAGAGRVFDIDSTTVNILGLTIADGNIGDNGGGILNRGKLALNNCTLSGNTASGWTGGGLFNEAGGHLTLTNCTFAGNSASYGAGLDNEDTATVTNCTFIGNQAGFTGGGIMNNGGLLTVRSCTITGNAVLNNTVDSGGGGINDEGNTGMHVGNTIIAGNTSAATGPDVRGTFTSDGYNLIGDASGASGFPGTGDRVGVPFAQVKLGPLQNNGGPTDTLALLAGSVAIDTGKSFGLSTDQRGLPRPVDVPGIASATGGNGSDSGAFEVQAPFLTINDVSKAEGNSGTSIVTFTVTLAPSSAKTVTVRYATANATATAGSDYVAKAGTLSFAPGVATQPISITINGDALLEPNEIFKVNLLDAVNASILDSQGAGTIVNDDASE